MKVTHRGAAKKVPTQKVSPTTLMASSHTRSPGYITSPGNVVGAAAHTYAHRDGHGPKHGYGSPDVRPSDMAGKYGGAPGKDSTSSYYSPPAPQTERSL